MGDPFDICGEGLDSDPGLIYFLIDKLRKQTLRYGVVKIAHSSGAF